MNFPLKSIHGNCFSRWFLARMITVITWHGAPGIWSCQVMATSQEAQTPRWHHRIDHHYSAGYPDFPSIAHHNNIISYILLHSINPVSSDIALIITRTHVRMSHYYLLFILGCSITSGLRGYIMFNQSMKLKHWHPNESKYLAVRAYQVAVMQF